MTSWGVTHAPTYNNAARPTARAQPAPPRPSLFTGPRHPQKYDFALAERELQLPWNERKARNSPLFSNSGTLDPAAERPPSLYSGHVAGVDLVVGAAVRSSSRTPRRALGTMPPDQAMGLRPARRPFFRARRPPARAGV